MQNKKYSILIPTRNGRTYLPYCLDSVLSQNYDNFELIISDNHSTDGTWDYLQTLTDKHISVIQPPKSLSMSLHYEWIVAQATGEWLVILGDDDALQPYFFKLAEALTAQAAAKNIQVINSKRAYFFWKGCQAVYGPSAVVYLAKAECQIKNFRAQAIRVLLGLSAYVDMPQMYTTSLVRRTVVEKIKARQGGVVYVSTTPDANGAAALCSLGERYLDCGIPLGWVGSSPKSYGVLGEIKDGRAKVLDNAETQKQIQDMNDLFYKNNPLKWNALAGDESIRSMTLYFWEALLQTHKLQPFWVRALYNSKLLKILIFSAVLAEITKDTKTQEYRLKFFKELLELQYCNLSTVDFCSRRILPIVRKLLELNIFGMIHRKIRKLIAIMLRKQRTSLPALNCNLDWQDDLNLNITEASQKISALFAAQGPIDKYIANGVL